MDDRALVANRNNSFLLIYTSILSEVYKIWPNRYGNVQPTCDFTASNLPKLFNELGAMKITMIIRESCYYKQVAHDLSDEIEIIDCSANNTDENIQFVSNSNVKVVAVEEIETMVAYCKAGYTGDFALFVSSTESLHDCGCEVNDVVSLLSQAADNGFNVVSLVFTCTRSEYLSSVLTAMDQAASDIQSHSLPLPTMYILGEGVHSLSEKTDEQSLNNLARLKDLADRMPVKIDGSFFFFSSIITVYIRIYGKKYRTLNNEERFLYYANNGVYCSFFNAHIRKQIKQPEAIFVTSPESRREGKKYNSTVFGPTCDSIDTLSDHFVFTELEVGDWLKFKGVGYRCGNYSAHFNGFPEPDVIYV